MMKPRTLAIAAAMIVGLSAGAAAQSATNIGTFKDWSTFTSDDPGGKICFVASQPTGSKYSKTISGRDPAFLQITSIPTKTIRNEVSTILGFTVAPNADVTITVDTTPFKMFLDASHPDTAWSMPDTEAALVDAMKHGHTLTVSSASKRGTTVADTYSLAGVTAAIDKMTKECP